MDDHRLIAAHCSAWFGGEAVCHTRDSLVTRARSRGAPVPVRRSVRSVAMRLPQERSMNSGALHYQSVHYDCAHSSSWPNVSCTATRLSMHFSLDAVTWRRTARFSTGTE
jgi:hypothetical protein